MRPEVVNSGMCLLSASGHKPSFYVRFFDRLLCDVKQPLSWLPGDRLSSAITSHSSSLDSRGFAQVSRRSRCRRHQGNRERSRDCRPRHA